MAFLAAVLVLAELCDREGLFDATGHRMVGASRGRPLALLAVVFVVGSAVTAVLSLDATVARPRPSRRAVVALAVPALATGRAAPADLGRALDVPFLAFVVALGVVVWKVLIWIVEGTWDGCVDAARAVLPGAAEAAEAADGADLLVLARDGDRSRLGPHSLGPATRFVVDHAPCAVLLTWPARAPDVASIPPPPAHPPPPPGGP